MKEIKIYIAGKISANSVFKTHHWRDEVIKVLSTKSGFKIKNLDPAKSKENQNNPELIVGQDCFLIKSADLVIVFLSDDISVGGSQEMLIAKYFNKPLIGIAPRGGKFNKDKENILGKTYTNWKHPFVAVTCDTVVESVEEAGSHIKEYFQKSKKTFKNIKILDYCLKYYLKAGKLPKNK
ncbi:hypothetical protein M1307_03075 [Patescibacteria group bacterium]|nr:hypothetical protein [Patescibacteria group bacterium]